MGDREDLLSVREVVAVKLGVNSDLVPANFYKYIHRREHHTSLFRALYYNSNVYMYTCTEEGAPGKVSKS